MRLWARMTELLKARGSQEVDVRPHARVSRGGKVATVKPHRAKRARADAWEDRARRVADWIDNATRDEYAAVAVQVRSRLGLPEPVGRPRKPSTEGLDAATDAESRAWVDALDRVIRGEGPTSEEKARIREAAEHRARVQAKLDEEDRYEAQGLEVEPGVPLEKLRGRKVWLYHGTSSALLDRVKREGLRAPDDPSGRSNVGGKGEEHSTRPVVFLTADGGDSVGGAGGYARRAARKHGGEPVVLRVLVDGDDLDHDHDDTDTTGGRWQFEIDEVAPDQIMEIDGDPMQKGRAATRAQLEAAGQGSMFGGTQQVMVKPHARVTASGKVAAVRQHQAMRPKADERPATATEQLGAELGSTPASAGLRRVLGRLCHGYAYEASLTMQDPSSVADKPEMQEAMARLIFTRHAFRVAESLVTAAAAQTPLVLVMASQFSDDEWMGKIQGFAAALDQGWEATREYLLARQPDGVKVLDHRGNPARERLAPSEIKDRQRVDRDLATMARLLRFQRVAHRALGEAEEAAREVGWHPADVRDLPRSDAAYGYGDVMAQFTAMVDAATDAGMLALWAWGNADPSNPTVRAFCSGAGRETMWDPRTGQTEPVRIEPKDRWVGERLRAHARRALDGRVAVMLHRGVRLPPDVFGRLAPGTTIPLSGASAFTDSEATARVYARGASTGSPKGDAVLRVYATRDDLDEAVACRLDRGTGAIEEVIFPHRAMRVLSVADGMIDVELVP